MARQNALQQWIQEALTNEEKGKCTRLALVHIRNGGQEKEVHVITLGDRQWNVKTLAETFRSKAENYAEGIHGTQTFNVLAFYGNSSEPGLDKPFVVHGYTETEGLATEAPTSTGIVQQTMRHLEVQTQTFMRQLGTMFGQTGDIITQLGHSNVRIAQENREMTELVRDLLLERADKRHGHRMEELKLQGSQQVQNKLLTAMPALINSLTGKEVFPQSASDTSLVEMLIDAVLEKGDLTSLANLNLPGPAMAALAKRFEQGIKARQLEAHARQSNGNDTDDFAEGTH